MFWAPEALSTVLSLREASSFGGSERYYLDLTRVPGNEFRRGPDAWHGILPLGGAIHRVCLPNIPDGGSLFAVELRLDANFDIRLRAARRLLSAIEGRRLPTPPLALPRQRRRRLILTIRALDAWLQGHSYREIAEGLFGEARVMGRSWRAHDLRSQIIRLVQNGLAMMRGGYRALLRPPSRKK
ncbi:MAG: DUF2285 domain-containing protein [Xanthobacteraceae bacterium]|nr:DUF2285 domain-containing protein [Xanthobacteraceae bacterium]